MDDTKATTITMPDEPTQEQHAEGAKRAMIHALDGRVKANATLQRRAALSPHAVDAGAALLDTLTLLCQGLIMLLDEQLAHTERGRVVTYRQPPGPNSGPRLVS